MLNNYARLVHSCYPLTIAKSDSPDGSRIGGRAPLDGDPLWVSPATRYFATLDLGGGTQASIFLSVEYNRESSADFLKNRFVLHSSRNPLVQLIAHASCGRRSDDVMASELNGLGLIIEPERPDAANREENLIWNHHKIGGYPFFWQEADELSRQVRDVTKSGFFHLLQFGFPDAADGPVSGSWPFGEYVFHVFTKEDQGIIDYFYCWG